ALSAGFDRHVDRGARRRCDTVRRTAYFTVHIEHLRRDHDVLYHSRARASRAVGEIPSPVHRASTSFAQSRAIVERAMDAFNGLLHNALLVTAVLAFPVLIVATVVGTLIAIVQAATSVQEQTLTMLPKLAVVGLMVLLFGGLGLRLCAQLF